MAKKDKKNESSVRLQKPTVKRKGIHTKTKASNHKKSKNYSKKYKGQGK